MISLIYVRKATISQKLKHFIRGKTYKKYSLADGVVHQKSQTVLIWYAQTSIYHTGTENNHDAFLMVHYPDVYTAGDPWANGTLIGDHLKWENAHTSCWFPARELTKHSAYISCKPLGTLHVINRIWNQCVLCEDDMIMLVMEQVNIKVIPIWFPLTNCMFL